MIILNNRHRFNMLWRHVRWSHLTDLKDEGTSHEAHQWKLVEDFVTHFNEYGSSPSLLRILVVLFYNALALNKLLNTADQSSSAADINHPSIRRRSPSPGGAHRS